MKTYTVQYEPRRGGKRLGLRAAAMRRVILILLVGVSVVGHAAAQTVLDFAAEDIHGRVVALEEYRGSVLLIVNTASKCGFTYQFEGLQRVYERYRDEGLVVLGFPSDNFANQEFETEAEILGFCTGEYGVDFPMFAKIDVGGQTAHPLYAFLTSRESNPEFGGRITWNFNKFLADREGRIVARFDSRVEPEDPVVLAAIERALGR